jgi:uncharacterized protein
LGLSLFEPRRVPARLVQLARNDRFKVVISAPLLEELMDVLTRPRLIRTRRLEIDEVNDFLTDVAHISALATISSALTICRDPDDNAVLETALAGHIHRQSRRRPDARSGFA